VCDTPLSNSRAIFCSVACKQRAFRLRHRPSAVDEGVVRQLLKRQRMLVAHAIYQCPNCDEPLLGERRCSACQLFCRVVGLGGQCPESDQPILLADLLGVDGTTAQ
jgi:hypothetical protein